MSAGLFGKLPSKRDFVAARAPRRFLEAWEPWLQAGVATSREILGPLWLEFYNSAPIWRFWLGAGLCGEPTLGAFMASVDGVGRSFPLTIFTSDGDEPAPPELDANEAWFDSAEAILLDALDPAVNFETIAHAAGELSSPAAPIASSPADLEALAEGAILARGAGANPSRTFAEARRFGRRQAYATQSFWWTIGGEGFPPLALAVVGLPLATRFADMLTGAFGAEPPRREEGSHGA